MLILLHTRAHTRPQIKDMNVKSPYCVSEESCLQSCLCNGVAVKMANVVIQINTIALCNHIPVSSTRLCCLFDEVVVSANR